MVERIRMLSAEHDGDDGLLVTFSDGTTGAYVVEELLELRPYRERTKTKKTQKVPGLKSPGLKSRGLKSPGAKSPGLKTSGVKSPI
jgi:hypothetical protein